MGPRRPSIAATSISCRLTKRKNRLFTFIPQNKLNFAAINDVSIDVITDYITIGITCHTCCAPFRITIGIERLQRFSRRRCCYCNNHWNKLNWIELNLVNLSGFATMKTRLLAQRGRYGMTPEYWVCVDMVQWPPYETRRCNRLFRKISNNYGVIWR